MSFFTNSNELKFNCIAYNGTIYSLAISISIEDNVNDDTLYFQSMCYHL